MNYNKVFFPIIIFDEEAEMSPNVFLSILTPLFSSVDLDVSLLHAVILINPL